MIDLKWGEEVDYWAGRRKRFLIEIGICWLNIRDFKKNKSMHLMKGGDKSFALCRPIWIGEGEDFKWFLGWYTRPIIDFMTDRYDPILRDIHLWNKVWHIKR